MTSKTGKQIDVSAIDWVSVLTWDKPDTSFSNEETRTMDRTKVKSKLIKSIGYDITSQTLEVEFIDFEISSFANISHSLYQELMKSPSKGSFFIQNISSKYASKVKRVRKKVLSQY